MSSLYRVGITTRSPHERQSFFTDNSYRRLKQGWKRRSSTCFGMTYSNKNEMSQIVLNGGWRYERDDLRSRMSSLSGWKQNWKNSQRYRRKLEVIIFFVIPCEKSFLFCMAFSVHEVVHVACLSHSRFVYGYKKPTTRQTSHANDFVNAKRKTPWKRKTSARRVFSLLGKILGVKFIISTMFHFQYYSNLFVA